MRAGILREGKRGKEDERWSDGIKVKVSTMLYLILSPMFASPQKTREWHSTGSGFSRSESQCLGNVVLVF